MSQSVGQAGEEYTAEWLSHHGYRVIERNYHSRFGEIDIIAVNSQYIVFVEVKTRQSNGMVSVLEAITLQKQQKIITTAQVYLSQYQGNLQPRFDVAAVTAQGGKPLGLKYFPNAFGS